MATQEDVEIFLKQFRVKMEIFGIIFRNDRGKSIQTLLDLNITELERLQVVKTIEIEDYSEGPIADTLNNGMDMWVFGKDVHDKEVYIKITMGLNGLHTICISFHVAEYPMNYPFKNKQGV